jgi:integrase/recombinase XerD
MSRLPDDAPRRRRYPLWGGRSEEPIPPIPGDATDAEGFAILGEQHRLWMESRQHTHNSQRCRLNNLRYFAAWCQERSIQKPKDVTFELIERYQRHLYEYRKPDGQALSPSTQASRVGQVGRFFSWLTKRRLIPVNPAADIEMPRRGMRLPRAVLTLDEIEAMLAVPDVATPRGLRNRAVCEVFFSTGMRREELVRLLLTDVRGNGTVFIRDGKGGKDRMVPIGASAKHWLARYLAEVRQTWVPEGGSDAVFLTPRKAPMGLAMLTNTIREYAHAAGITKRGGCHLFRHTCATLMLDNGADLRFVQEILGHADVRSTEVYTHIAISALKEVHRMTHPAECGRDGGLAAAPTDPAVRAAFLAALDAEGKAEAGDNA